MVGRVVILSIGAVVPVIRFDPPPRWIGSVFKRSLTGPDIVRDVRQPRDQVVTDANKLNAGSADNCESFASLC